MTKYEVKFSGRTRSERVNGTSKHELRDNIFKVLRRLKGGTREDGRFEVRSESSYGVVESGRYFVPPSWDVRGRIVVEFKDGSRRVEL